MTDDNTDPWRSLADELGVQPGQEPPPPQPPASSPPPEPFRHHRSSSPPSPPKKSPGDWQSLAGELGIELPPEPAKRLKTPDPVADLLGFPPPSELPPLEEEDKQRVRDEEFAEHEDGDWDQDSPRDRWQDSREDGPANQGDYGDQASGRYDQREESSQYLSEGPPSDDRAYRPRGRRGGRGRGGNRSDRSRAQGGGNRSDNRSRGGQYSQEGGRYPSPQSEQPPRYDDQRRSDADEAGSISGERSSYEPAGDLNNRTDEDQPRQKSRRRRGRRGRGGSRNRDENRSVDQTRPSSQPGGEVTHRDLESDDDLEIDFLPLPDESDQGAVHDSLAATPDLGDEHDEELAGADDAMSGRGSVRDIVTWKEAIGMIIDGNMQARANSPQTSHPPRSSHGRGRGRGRGRGGYRGG